MSASGGPGLAGDQMTNGRSMRGTSLAIVLVLCAMSAGASFAQTATPGNSAAGRVKAVQPGLFDVAGPRVNDVVAAGIHRITATPGKGWRSVYVESPWGSSYFGWPKGLPEVAFTITTGGAGGTATISAPGFTAAKQDDYKLAIEKISQYAIEKTNYDRRLGEGSR